MPTAGRRDETRPVTAAGQLLETYPTTRFGTDLDCCGDTTGRVLSRHTGYDATSPARC